MGELIIRTTVRQPEPDRRYRVWVQLQRSDRPRYWNFICPHCGTPLVELVNKDIFVIKDFFDPQNLNNSAVGIRCGGKYCRFTYYFSVA